MANAADIEVKTRELTELILESDEYIRFRKAKEKLLEDQDLYNRVMEYRKRNFYMQNSGQGNQVDERNNLMRDFGEVLRRNRVREYLDAEIVLCRILQNVNEVLYKDIDVEASFL